MDGVGKFIWVVLVLTAGFSPVRSQGSNIVSISSFNFCLNIAPESNDIPEGSTAENQYIDCVTPESTVTTVQLRILAGTTSNTLFNFDLTTVPTRNAGRTNTDGRICGADPNGFEDCVVTTPVQVQIESSKYTLFYKMRQSDLMLPQYCYVGRFDAKKSTTLNYKLARAQAMNYAGVIGCLQNIHVQACSAEDGTSCDDILGMFNDPVTVAKNQFVQVNSTKDPRIYKNARMRDGTFDDQPYPNSVNTCRDTMFSFDSIRKGSVPAELYRSSDSNSFQGFNSISRDDYPTVSSFPISDPEPLPLQSKVNTVYKDVLQYSLCAGYSCGGGYSAVCYEDFYDTLEETAQSTAFNAEAGTSAGARNDRVLIGTVGMEFELFSLGPECVLYEIDEIPEVLLTINVSVRANFSNEDGDVDTDVNAFGFTSEQSFTLTNLMGYESEPSAQFAAGARVLDVDTLNGVIGPPLPGYIIMCGNPQNDYNKGGVRRNRSQDQRNPREDPGSRVGVAGEDELDPDSVGLQNYLFVDMNSYLRGPNDTYDPTENPWDTIRQGFPDKTRFYPTGENLNYSPIEGKPPRNCMWQFFDIDQSAWIGRGCNQLGITDLFWNENFEGGVPTSSAGAQQCYLSPFTCIPGYTQNSYGGRSVPPCLATAAMKADEVRDPDQYANNQEQIEYVLRNSLPRFYNPEDPNYWTLNDPSRGYGLAFDPSKSTYPNQALPVTLNLDFIGEFVSTSTTVPNGRVIEITCSNGTTGDLNTGNLTIENRGTISGSYVAQIQCPDDIIEIDSNELIFSDVAPGEASSSPFFYASDIEPDDFPTDDPCIVQLLPASGTSFVILETVAFSCTFIDIDSDDVDPPVVVVPPVDPFSIDIECDCFDFDCFIENGQEITDSACFWLLIGTLIGIAALFTVPTIFLGYYRWKRSYENNKLKDEVQKDYEEYRMSDYADEKRDRSEFDKSALVPG